MINIYEISQIIKKYFSDGLVFILPFLLTVLMVSFFVGIIQKWLLPLKNILPCFIQKIPYGECLVALLLVVVIGYIADTFLHGYFLYIENRVIKKIPFVGKVYSGIQQITRLVNKKQTVGGDQQTVAWVKIPYKNLHCLGIMTGTVHKDISPDASVVYYNFFVPHTPNPITGYYIIASEADCVFTSLTQQEAISMIMSAGVVQPTKM